MPMLELRNHTPLPAAIVPWLDKDGVDAAGIIVKGTFALGPRSTTSLAAQQVPLVRADQFHGDVEQTSVKYASDTSPLKLGTDLALLGHAYAPGGSAKVVDVGLQVGRTKKVIRVFGERRYVKSLGAWVVAGPLSFDRMPLIWERAFGGRDLTHPSPDKHAVDWRNPVGTGFAPSKSAARLEGLALPNLEEIHEPLTGPGSRTTPACFGFVAANWLPRRAHAGTYDDAWKKTRCPYLPKDFNARFYNAASADLVAVPHLLGGEPVKVAGASAQGFLGFDLPRPHLRIVATLAGKSSEHTPVLDTVIVEPDEMRVTLTWKASVPCARKFLYLERVTISAEGLT